MCKSNEHEQSRDLGTKQHQKHAKSHWTGITYNKIVITFEIFLLNKARLDQNKC